MTELMNGGVIFKRAIHFPDRVESSRAAFKSKKVLSKDIKYDPLHVCKKDQQTWAVCYVLQSELQIIFLF